MKDHEIAEMVNALVKICNQYSHTGQLRARISYEVTNTIKVSEDKMTQELKIENEQLKEEIVRLQTLIKSPWYDKTK